MSMTETNTTSVHVYYLLANGENLPMFLVVKTYILQNFKII
jgi:hypothetical protein